ncbi:MAG TPA: hypothetical protein VK907_08360, partial [Phnomibacter sp.]|nr:hypothetical protein [Phnomibacter sp.]
MKIKWFHILLAVFISSGISAQPTTWDNLTIPLPSGWSIKQKDGIFQYSNYNIRGMEPFSISLFPAQHYAGKMDTLFAHAWNLYVTEPYPVKEPPR